MKQLGLRIQTLGKRILSILGGLFLLILVLAFTDIPYYAYHHLGTINSELDTEPNVIVLLGGAGMPSPDGLIRCYYTVEAAETYPEALIVIAHPASESGDTWQSDLMAKELTSKCIDSTRIIYETEGYNTFTQAKGVKAIIDSLSRKSVVLIVTSPEHMYRAVAAFKKQGLAIAGGTSTFEKPLDEQELKSDDIDKIGRDVSVRYNMWSYLNYELLVIREYIAITYYKLRGWI